MDIPAYQGVSNKTASVSATSTQILNQQPANVMRTQMVITNLSPVTVTIAKSEVGATANEGIVLTQNQTYIEANDGGFLCWQGAVQAVATGAGTLSIVESVQTR